MKDEHGKRAWLYAQSAGAPQDESEGGVDFQLDRLRRHASDQELEIAGETVETAVSGNKLNRPGLTSLFEIAASDPKPFDILLVDGWSRLSRDMTGMSVILERLKLCGIEVHTPYDSNIFEYMAAQLCSYYTENRAEAARKRREISALSGHWPDRAPFGYVGVREAGGGGRTLVIQEDEAKVIQRAFQLAFNHEEGPSGVAERLNKAGHRMRSGRLWSASAVSRMLQNSAYAGSARIKATVNAKYINAKYLIGSKGEIRVAVPHLISRKLFFDVQRILCNRRLSRRPIRHD